MERKDNTAEKRLEISMIETVTNDHEHDTDAFGDIDPDDALFICSFHYCLIINNFLSLLNSPKL